MLPVHGQLGNYSHTREDAEVMFWCNNGFLPSEIMISTCAHTKEWIPPPQEFNCTPITGQKLIFIILDCQHSFAAFVTISPLVRNVSRSDIECPGDSISYRCSIQSNSEYIELTWKILFPDGNSVNFTYNNTSTTNQLEVLGHRTITTVLSSYIPEVYAESILTLTVLEGVDMNGTEIECSSSELNSSAVKVYFNTSGETKC